MPAASKFPNSNVRYKDTRNSGAITVAGFELNTDKDGYVEAPPSLEPMLFPHGFLRVGGAAFNAWSNDQQKVEKKG